jgi:hypothetical protein
VESEVIFQSGLIKDLVSGESSSLASIYSSTYPVQFFSLSCFADDFLVSYTMSSGRLESLFKISEITTMI